MTAGKEDRHAKPLDEVNREAALRALAHNWPKLEPSDIRYAAIVEGLAMFHREFGNDSFELRYNLRPPRNRTEQWSQQHFLGKITEDQYRALLKSDAERAIDLEMLNSVHDAYQEQLEHYSAVLQKAVLRPSDDREPVRKQREIEIDEHIGALSGKLPLWRENLETVFEFLDEVRITSGRGLVEIEEFEATSAHWLAQLAFSRMCEGWRSSKDIASRSAVDRKYLYKARAIDLFREQWHPTFPAPQKISERMREEVVMARVALRAVAKPVETLLKSATKFDGTSAATTSPIDNECRELILVGEFQAIVAKAGHIFRAMPNSDWGIDGEIEFKDSRGYPNGQRIYIQLKSGDSHLAKRKRDEVEIFTVKNDRHLEYWAQQIYPVFLVIRQSTGLIRWMNISDYLRTNGRTNRRIPFMGEPLTPEVVNSLNCSLSPSAHSGSPVDTKLAVAVDDNGITDGGC